MLRHDLLPALVGGGCGGPQGQDSLSQMRALTLARDQRGLRAEEAFSEAKQRIHQFIHPRTGRAGDEMNLIHIIESRFIYLALGKEIDLVNHDPSNRARSAHGSAWRRRCLALRLALRRIDYP